MKTVEDKKLIGTFIIEEYDGKKYKMLFVEEVPEEKTDEIISNDHRNNFSRETSRQ
ncbi:hypothetical protein [Dyadobacter sp. 3J3]|uniref:hypothetical protein n=1 Tax=Dyadobacter sp. 3J3 TaxID=2606600 RepID=UPI00135B7D79|nr:hypothetical protein [Dyadobacter sp. 3J3]